MVNDGSGTREMAADPTNAFQWMDAFRAIAAALVALSHLRDMIWTDATHGIAMPWQFVYFVTGFGHSGVIVFFTLSGFWIAGAVIRRIDNPDFWRFYLIDRISRLWIVLIPVLFVGGLLDFLGVHILQTPNYLGQSGMHSQRAPVIETLGLHEFVGSLAFLARIVTSPLGSNGPLWSLSFEFWYYIWFPAIMFLLVKRRFTWPMLSLLLAFFSPILAFGFISWLTGFLLYVAFQSSILRDRAFWPPLTMLVALAPFLIFLMIARVSHVPWSDPALALSFAVFLFALCRANPRIPGALKPLAKFGADASFSLYALHFPVAMMLCGLLLSGKRGDPSVANFSVMVAVFAALVVVSYGFSRITEARTGDLRTAMRKCVSASVHPSNPP